MAQLSWLKALSLSWHNTNLGLDNDHLIAMMKVFKNDADAADMFMAMKHESTCKTWVKSELLKLGFVMDAHMQD